MKKVLECKESIESDGLKNKLTLVFLKEEDKNLGGYHLEDKS